MLFYRIVNTFICHARLPGQLSEYCRLGDLQTSLSEVWHSPCPVEESTLICLTSIQSGPKKCQLRKSVWMLSILEICTAEKSVVVWPMTKSPLLKISDCCLVDLNLNVLTRTLDAKVRREKCTAFNSKTVMWNWLSPNNHLSGTTELFRWSPTSTWRNLLL